MGLTLTVNGRHIDPQITRTLETVIAEARKSWQAPESDKHSEIYIVNTISDMLAYFPALPDGEKEIPFGVEQNSAVFCYYDENSRSYNMGVIKNNIGKIPAIMENLGAALAHDIAHIYNNDADTIAKIAGLLDSVSAYTLGNSYLLFVLNNSLCEFTAEDAAISLGYERGLWAIRKHEHVLANESPSPQELMEEGITVYGFLGLFEKKAGDETIRSEAKQAKSYLRSKFEKTFSANTVRIDSICSFIDKVIEKKAYLHTEKLKKCGRINLKNFDYLTCLRL